MPFFLKKFHMGFQSVSSSLRFSQSAASESASTRLYCRCSYSYHLLPKALVTLVTIVTDKTGFRLLFRPCHYTLSYIIMDWPSQVYINLYIYSGTIISSGACIWNTSIGWVSPAIRSWWWSRANERLIGWTLFFNRVEHHLFLTLYAQDYLTTERIGIGYFESFVAAKQESINVSSNELSFREIERLQ